MNIKQLRHIIADLPDDMLVVAVRGMESEHAAVVIHYEQLMYVPHTPWRGFIFSLSEAQELGERAARVLVLQPAH